LMFVEVFALQDERYELVIRVWEDGRLEGRPSWMRTVAACRRPDPITGEVAMRGPGLIRRLASCFNNGYLFARINVWEVRRLPEQPLRRRRN